MTATVSSTVSNVFPFNNAVSGAYGGVNNVESYLDRTNGETVAFGVIRKFAGFYHRCVVSGTLAGAEPTIIAPLGALERVTNGTFDTDLSGWTVDASTTWAAGKAVIDGSQAAFAFPLRQNGILTNLHSYLVKITASNVTQDAIRARADGATGTTLSANGTATDVLTSSASGDIIVQSTGGTGKYIGSVDDISAVEVTKDGTAAWETIEII